VKVARYGDEYFKLVEKHGTEMARYLAIAEPLISELEGKVYAF
jgi:hypothetical protein